MILFLHLQSHNFVTEEVIEIQSKKCGDSRVIESHLQEASFYKSADSCFVSTNYLMEAMNSE